MSPKRDKATDLNTMGDIYKEMTDEKTELMSGKKRKKQILPKSITSDEFVKLIKVIPEKDKVSKISFLLAFASGLRLSEIAGSDEEANKIPALSKDNFKMDLNPPQITVYGKYSKERVVPVPKGWKQWMFDLLPIKKSGRTLERKFKMYAKLAALDPKYTFHSLRHGFATNAIESGIPITHVQYMLGHSNVATTNIYTKARPQDALNSYQELFK